jgi:hypothetical protein
MRDMHRVKRVHRDNLDTVYNLPTPCPFTQSDDTFSLIYGNSPLLFVWRSEHQMRGNTRCPGTCATRHTCAVAQASYAAGEISS